jgi:hypothetical protein
MYRSRMKTTIVKKNIPSLRLASNGSILKDYDEVDDFPLIRFSTSPGQ